MYSNIHSHTAASSCRFLRQDHRSVYYLLAVGVSKERLAFAGGQGDSSMSLCQHSLLTGLSCHREAQPGSSAPQPCVGSSSNTPQGMPEGSWGQRGLKLHQPRAGELTWGSSDQLLCGECKQPSPIHHLHQSFIKQEQSERRNKLKNTLVSAWNLCKIHLVLSCCCPFTD